MLPGQPAKLLRIHIGESDRYGGKPLYEAIVNKCREMKIAGATVFRGVEGYGASNHLHTTRFLSLSDDLPLCIVIVDSAAAIDAFTRHLDELIDGGLVIVEDVEVLRYVRHDRDGAP